MRILPFKMNAFDQISAGNISKLKLSNGPTYQEIVLETNVPAAEIDKVTIDLGGVHSVGQIIEMKGTELEAFEKYKGQTGQGAGPVYYHVIPLGSREAKTDAGMMMTGLVTLAQDNIILSVHLAGSVTPTTPYITAWAYASAARSVRSVIPMIKPHTIVITGTGEQDYMSLPADPGMRYRRLWLKDGDLSRVELWKDGVREVEEDVSVTEFIQKREDLVPQTDWVVTDFVRNGYVVADVFSPQYRTELKLRLTVGTAENVRMLVEGYKVLSQDNVQQ